MNHAPPEIERDEARGVLVVRHYGQTAEIPLAEYDALNPYQQRVLARNIVLQHHTESGPEASDA